MPERGDCQIGDSHMWTRNRAHRSRQLALGVEPLECRLLLSTTIPFVQVRGTLLEIRPAPTAEWTRLEQDGNRLRVQSETNGLVQLNVGAVRRIRFELGDGTDQVTILNTRGPFAVQLVSLRGELSADIEGSQLTSLQTIGDPVQSDIELASTQLTGDVRLVAVGAGFTFEARQSTIGGSLVFQEQTIIADVELSQTYVGGSIQWQSRGRGDRQLQLDDVRLAGMNWQTADGNAAVESKGQTRIAGPVSLQTAAGSQRLDLRDDTRISATTRQRIANGRSTTWLRERATIEGTLDIRAPGGADIRVLDAATIGGIVGPTVQVRSGIVYARPDGRDLRADLYLPAGPGPHPAIVMLHGGLWRLGSRSTMSWEARQLASRGYVVMAIDYRLAPQSIFPAQILDAKTAVYWLRAQAAQYGVDPSRIASYGYSAGAQLALLLGATDANSPLEPSWPAPTPLGSRVQAAVGLAPPTDFRDLPPDSNEFAYFLGGTPTSASQNYALASPAYWVTGDDAPTFLAVGADDRLVNATAVRRYATALGQVGVYHELRVLAGQNHFSIQRHLATVLAAGNFLDRALKSLPPTA